MSATYPAIAFNDRLVRLIGIPIVGFLVPLIFFNKTLSHGLVAYLPSWLIATLYTAVYWHGSRAIFIWTHAYFPAVEQIRQRIGWLVGLALAFTLGANGLLDLLFWDVFPLIHANGPGPSALQVVAASLLPSLTCLALYGSTAYLQQLQVALLETEQLKKANAQSQLETLKNQVNPHFLFNSLNTLAAIIPEDAALAVDFVQKLSKVYRYILEIREAQTVCLRDELAAMRAYNFLLQIRFGTNLTIVTHVPDDRLTDHVVPLSLQMLMENAVKHNVISTQKPLRVEIFVQNDRVIMRNNLQRKNQLSHYQLAHFAGGPISRHSFTNEEHPTDAAAPDPADEAVASTGLGLVNIKDRYWLVAGCAVDVIVTTRTFSVSLPLLPPPRP